MIDQFADMLDHVCAVFDANDFAFNLAMKEREKVEFRSECSLLHWGNSVKQTTLPYYQSIVENSRTFLVYLQYRSVPKSSVENQFRFLVNRIHTCWICTCVGTGFVVYPCKINHEQVFVMIDRHNPTYYHRNYPACNDNRHNDRRLASAHHLSLNKKPD